MPTKTDKIIEELKEKLRKDNRYNAILAVEELEQAIKKLEQEKDKEI